MCTKRLRGKSDTGRTTTKKSISLETASDYPPPKFPVIKNPYRNCLEQSWREETKKKVKYSLRHRQKILESGNIFMVINLFRFVYLHVGNIQVYLHTIERVPS